MAVQAKKATAAKTAPEKAAKERVSVGSVARKAILAGKTNEQTIEAIKEKFPTAQTSNNSVNWYRSALRNEGHEVKSGRVNAPKAAKAPKAAAAKPAAPAKPAAKPANLKVVGGVTKAKATAVKPAPKADEDGGFD